MDDEKIKKAFQNVKQDIDSIKFTLDSLKKEIFDLNSSIKSQQNISTQTPENSTISTHSSTQIDFFKPLKHQNSLISTGNEGVPTDRQTDRQTDRHKKINTINEAAEILDSLDNVKKELRLKFKQLTDQEIIIFSTIYQLDEEIGFSDYKTLSKKLSLTESSIRDYVGRLIKKGVPVEKNKINNKNIYLKISENLRRVVSLPTILQLRGL